MIHVEFTRKGGCFRLAANGHASYAPSGQDIVCAGVTALLQTLGRWLYTLEMNGSLFSAPRVKLDYGEADLSAKPSKGNRETVSSYFEMVLMGLQMIETEYPKCIEVIDQIHDGE